MLKIAFHPSLRVSTLASNRTPGSHYSHRLTPLNQKKIAAISHHKVL